MFCVPTLDFYREKDGFVQCINFQRKGSGDVLFIHLDRSCEFASYGLLVAGRATALKKEFRRVLSQANLD